MVGLSFDVEIMSEYDAASNRTDLKALVNGTADFWNEHLYDDLNRMTGVNQHGASVAEKRVDWAGGKSLRNSGPNGRWSSTR